MDDFGIELLPCPFCGSQPSLKNEDVICSNVSCWIGFSTDSDSFEEKIYKWNTRFESEEKESEFEFSGIDRYITKNEQNE